MVVHSDYQQINDGDKFVIKTDQELHLACCECGLTHAFIFKKVRGGVEIIVNRKDRITAAIRRHNKFPRKPR